MRRFCRIFAQKLAREQIICHLDVTELRVFKHIINITVWAILLLFIVLTIAVHLPAVQRQLGQQVSEVIGKKLGTEVQIGRVDLGIFNRLILDEVLIRDQQKDDMLHAARISAKVDVLSLLQGRIVISSAQLFGVHAKLYKTTSESPANFQFVIDSLASKDTTSHTPLDLRINSFIMRHSTVTYDIKDAPKTPNRLNPNHLNVRDISAHIILKALTDDSLNVNIKRLTFNELSGVQVRRLALRLNAGRRGATLQDLFLQLPTSQLRIDSIGATYLIDDMAKTLAYEGHLSSRRFTPSDLRSLLPGLNHFNQKLSFDASFSGTADGINMPTIHLAANDHSVQFDGSGELRHWREQMAWRANVGQLSVAKQFMADISNYITPLPDIVVRLGHVNMQGQAQCDDNGTLTAKGRTQTDVGQLTFDARLTKNRQISGTVSTPELRLDELLNASALGVVSADIALSGRLDEIHAKGNISRFDYNTYPYQNIQVDASLSSSKANGQLLIDDPHLFAELNGVMDIHKKQPSDVNLIGTIRNFNPSAVNLTDRWGDANIRGHVEANFSASSLNDAVGLFTLDNVAFEGTKHNYHLDFLRLESGYDDTSHYLTLQSDFAKAELRGRFDYNTLAQSIINFIGEKLPTLPGLPTTTEGIANDFALKLQVLKSDWLQELLGINIDLKAPLQLDAIVNDYTNDINLNAAIPAFSYDDNHFRDGRLIIVSPEDSMKCQVNVARVDGNGQQLYLDLKANAANNQIFSSLSWRNPINPSELSGHVNTITQLYTNPVGKAEAHLRMLPSEVIFNSSRWQIEPSDVLYSDNRLLIDHFEVHHDDQHLIVDGIASDSAEDSIIVDLNDLDVAYILNLVDFDAVEFGGTATGQAYAKSVFKTPELWADLQVKQFTFQRGRMGTLLANVNWNKEREQIDIQAVANDGKDINTYVDGYVSPARNFLDLTIRADSSYIDFMQYFTESFLSHLEGHTSGQVRLAGDLDYLNLEGYAIVNGKATIAALNTTYELRNDTVRLVPDHIYIDHQPLYDRNNHVAYIDGTLNHENISNLTFDIDIEAQNLLAYDFRDFGEDSFYGTVYATGKVDMHGRPGEVVINCNVTPEPHSTFVYNATNPDAISNQEFITWGSRNAYAHPSADSVAVTRVAPRDLTTDIFINFLVNTTPEATVRILMDSKMGDYITFNGSGVIRASFHNKGAFNMYGTYTIDHGTYDLTIQNIIKKKFTFQQGGTLVFGGNPMNANLNLQALYTVNGVSLSDLNIGNSFSNNNTVKVNCLMNIFGQPSAPRIDFDLDLPNVNADEKQMVRSVINGEQEMNQQVLYLLGIGRFYQQPTNNATAGQTAQASLAMQSFLSGTLSTQINEVLQQVIKTRNWNFGANISTGTEGWNNAEYEGLISGRMLNNRLLINGQFGYRDNATNANSSFIGDFDIRYLLFPNGNLAFKVYNQTNDRYFTRSALNTQGIGLIMKKDFDSLGDLFGRKKKVKP